MGAPGPAGEDPALRMDCEWRLGLAHALHTSLEVERLVEIFVHHSARIVACDALELSVAGAPALAARGRPVCVFRTGRPAGHRHRVDLVLEGLAPGRITFSRRRPFAASETRALDAMAADLVHPLGNALRYREARQAAARDPLTGAANRSGLSRALEREIGLARRHGSALALCMVDVDRFKRINDRFGHLAGDRSLRAVAACIAGCIRDSDMLFRYGGEEFCIVLSRTGAGGARRLAERVRAAVHALRIPAGSETLRLTVSLGVASLSPGESAAALVEKADAALYRSKRAGRNTVSAPAAEPDRRPRSAR